jgi:hypothetical protein
MTTYYLNGSPITEGSDINLNGMAYPYSWLEGTSPSVRASLGIEATDDITFDGKYYNSKDIAKPLDDREELDDNGDPAYLKEWDAETETMVDTSVRQISYGLKTTCLIEVRLKTNDLLKPTDYLIIRNEVESVEIPTDVTAYRAAIVTESDRVVTAIAAVESVDALITVMSSIAWPTFPVTVVVEQELPDPRNLPA